MNKDTHYDASDIQVLEGLEAVRKRPGMYIGATSSRGLHHLVWEIVDNAIDEALAGFCDDIEVIINKDESITVRDDGRGIPVGIHKKTGLSTVETVFTILHAGGKFGGSGYKVSGGLHGVGGSVVNALSSWLEATIYQDGKVHYIRFEDGGKPVKPLEIIDTCSLDRTGTTITFKPDPSIFTETQTFDYEILRTRIRELAFLNKNLKIILCDERDVNELKKEEFIYEGGISAYVELLNKNKTPIHNNIVHFSSEIDNISLEIAFQYNSSYTTNVYSFTNNIHTHEGGTHEDGVKNSLTRIINNYARNHKYLKDNEESLTGDDVREGLTMIISCKHPNPQFEGQTKTKLGNSEVRKISSDIFSDGFERFLLENPDQAKTIIEKSLTASRARLAAKKARELTRRKGGLELTNQWGKLTDCSSKDASISEIFIVEGDSAAGPAKQGRNSATQAVLPIRGKILNVEKARLDRILGNEEIRSIITAFGTGIGDEFDITKLRYHKIIIMTDADVDGAHIRTLLLTFFYRYFKPLVEAGHIYAAQPPLFKISHGKTSKYVLNEVERDEYLSTLPENTKYDITRMKGLGEMDAIELRETTMHIDTRLLVKIELDDAIAADEIFQILMGEEVEPRRKFIEDNALNVKNLDV
ncbi:MAG: DNA topoisomerase (ATP-hydrolyzing) subunit B [Bacilli bacterium]|nr:DNA topoisomerase (ATP-hydrolyzing) subunit B [Bacilli bacterium]MDD4809095.1 DNA topoisomerase (ATP-hydrolyzing) subunit B [Bacilli bacterium]